MIVKNILISIITAVLMLSFTIILQGCSEKEEAAKVKSEKLSSSAESEKGGAHSGRRAACDAIIFLIPHHTAMHNGK